MNIQELRIGSVVNVDRGKSVKVVSFDFGNSAITSSKGKSHNAASISGIPITSEWLQRCGAVHLDGNYWALGNITVLLGNDLVRVVYDGSIENEIKYIHQLQALVYSLTGCELVLSEGIAKPKSINWRLVGIIAAATIAATSALIYFL